MDKITINGQVYYKRTLGQKIFARTVFDIPIFFMAILIFLSDKKPEQFYFFQMISILLFTGLASRWMFEIQFKAPKNYLYFIIFSTFITLIIWGNPFTHLLSGAKTKCQKVGE